MNVATFLLALTILSGSSSSTYAQDADEAFIPFETLIRDISFSVEQIRAGAGEPASALYEDAISQLEASLNRPLWHQVLTELSEILPQVDAVLVNPFFDDVGLDAFLATFASTTVGTGNDLGTRLIARVRRAIDAIMVAIENYPEWEQTQATSIFNDQNLLGLLAPLVETLTGFSASVLNFLFGSTAGGLVGPHLFAAQIFASAGAAGAEAAIPALTALYNKLKEFNDAIRLLISNGLGLYQTWFDALGSEALPYVQLVLTQLREFVRALFAFLPYPLNQSGAPQIGLGAVQNFWAFLIEWTPKILAVPAIWVDLIDTVVAAYISFTEGSANIPWETPVELIAYYAQLNQAIAADIQSAIDSA